MMTQNIAWWTCFGGTIPPFHLSTAVAKRLDHGSQPGMTRLLSGLVCFRACGADSLLRRYGKRRHTIADAFLSFAHIGSQQLEGGVHGLCVGAFIAVGGKDSGSDLLWPESLASQKSD